MGPVVARGLLFATVFWTLTGAFLGASADADANFPKADWPETEEFPSPPSIASDYPESANIEIHLEGGGTGYCSGALIAPRIVVTAGHCVVAGKSWQVTMPFAGDQSARAIAYSTGYRAAADPKNVNADSHDIGLLILDKPIPLAVYPTIETRPLPSGTQVRNLGRMIDGTITNSFYVGSKVSVFDGSKYGYPFDYVAKGAINIGDSGGPVMKDGTHTLVAINSGIGRGIEALARVDLVAPWITKVIEKTQRD